MGLYFYRLHCVPDWELLVLVLAQEKPQRQPVLKLAKIQNYIVLFPARVYWHNPLFGSVYFLFDLSKTVSSFWSLSPSLRRKGLCNAWKAAILRSDGYWVPTENTGVLPL